MLSQYCSHFLSNTTRKFIFLTNVQHKTLPILHRFYKCISYSKSELSNLFIRRYYCLTATYVSRFKEKSANSECLSPKRELLVINSTFYNYSQTSSFSTEFLLPENIDSFKCEHPDCRDLVAFTSQKHLETHTKRCHSADEYQCTFCDQIFGQKRLLTAHVKLVHKNDFEFVCDSCAKRFHRKDELKHHLLWHKNETENLLSHHCPHCEKRFNHRHYLLKHVQYMHKAPAFKCNFINCGQTFKSMAYLRNHMATHDDSLREHRCIFEGCNQAFVQESHLKSHVQKFHEKKPKRFVCDFINCGMAFLRKLDLRKHKLVHSYGEVDTALQEESAECERNRKSNEVETISKKLMESRNKYKCDYPGCDERFSQKILWLRHKSSHEKEFGFGCRYCQMKFTKKENCRLHEFIIHNEQYLSPDKGTGR